MNQTKREPLIATFVPPPAISFRSWSVMPASEIPAP